MSLNNSISWFQIIDTVWLKEPIYLYQSANIGGVFNKESKSYSQIGQASAYLTDLCRPSFP